MVVLLPLVFLSGVLGTETCVSATPYQDCPVGDLDGCYGASLHFHPVYILGMYSPLLLNHTRLYVLNRVGKLAMNPYLQTFLPFLYGFVVKKFVFFSFSDKKWKKRGEKIKGGTNNAVFLINVKKKNKSDG